MKKCNLLLGLAIFLLLIQIPSAQAVTGVTIEVYPAQGDITTEIFVHVRGEPYRSSPSAVYLYVYYDDKLITMRKPAIFHEAGVSSWWELSWDIIFQIPNEFPYSELGIHNITAVIEADDGSSANTTATFEIVRYIPPPEWWRDLPQEFIDEITGPQGEVGPQGPQGDKGDTGPYPTEAVVANLGMSAVSGIISVIALSIVYKMKKKQKI